MRAHAKHLADKPTCFLKPAGVQHASPLWTTAITWGVEAHTCGLCRMQNFECIAAGVNGYQTLDASSLFSENAPNRFHLGHDMGACLARVLLLVLPSSF